MVGIDLFLVLAPAFGSSALGTPRLLAHSGCRFRRFRLLPQPFAVIPPDSWDSRLYLSTETIYLLRSPFPGLPTCVRSRPLVPPMPTGLGCLPLVGPFPALTRVVVPSFYLSRFHLPASLDSTGITPLLRYYGGSVTSRAQFFGPSIDHERCFLSRFVIPDSYRSNFRPFYLLPPYALLSFCSLFLPGIGRGVVAPPLRDAFRSWLRHRKGGLANASGRIEFNIVVFMDWSFASGCSPPRFSTTQLPSATDRPVFPSGKDFHPSVGAYFQAHLSWPFGPQTPR